MDTEKKFKETLASEMDKKLKEIKAAMPQDKSNSDMSNMYDYLDTCMASMRDYMYGAVDRLHQRISEHLQNHPPHPAGAEQMQNYLKAIGADKNYNVVKPNLYCNANRQGNKEFLVTLDIKK